MELSLLKKGTKLKVLNIKRKNDAVYSQKCYNVFDIYNERWFKNNV